METLSYLVENSRTVKETIIERIEFHKSFWFLMKDAKNESDIQKIIKMLNQLLNMQNFDYILSYSDFDYVMAIANKYAVFVSA